MQNILPLLCQLDNLYYADLAAYETLWKDICRHIEITFPGLTLAHVEVYTQGQERIPTGRMRHVLLPIERSAI
jgi:hypothetical protein